MAQAVFAFLMSILISLGGSVAADNIGQDFATIYNNQDASVKAKMDQYLFDPGGQLIRDLGIEGVKLSAEMYSNYHWENGEAKVSLADADDVIGMNAFKNFLITEQENVIKNTGSGIGSRSFGLSNGYSVEIYSFWNDDKFGAGSGSYDWGIRIVDDKGNTLCNDDDLQKSYLCHYGWAKVTDETKAVQLINLFNIDKDGNLSTYSSSGKIMEQISIPRYLKESFGIDVALDPEIPPELLPIIGANIGQVGDIYSGKYDIAPDGAITLADGSTVYPNADGTYTIDGVPYSPTYNLAAYDDTALLNLLQTLIDAQANGSAGDTTATNYSGVLGRILSAVNSLRSTFSSTMSSIKSKVSDILSAVKDLPSNISSAISSDLAISDEVKNKAISDLKTKVGYSAIQSNVNIISTTFFGERTFNDKGEVVIAPVFDTGETITTQRPHLYFTLFNKRYDLFSGLYMFDGAVNIFKGLVAFFLIIAFVFGFFRSLPSILLSFSEVKSITSPTVITNTFSNFGIFQTPNNNKPPKPQKANGKGG